MKKGRPMRHVIDKCMDCLLTEQQQPQLQSFCLFQRPLLVQILSCSIILFDYISIYPLLLRLWFLWPEEAGIRNKRSRNRCGCLGGCRFFGGTNMGLDFFKLEELTPSSSSAFSSSSTESDMSYGQSLLQPGEWIITKETPKVDGMDFM